MRGGGIEIGRGGWEQAPWAELLCFPLRMAFVLHQAGPHHSHGSRGAEYAPLEEGPSEPLSLGNTSVRAAFVHVLGDLLQSLGVLAASILIYFKVLSIMPVPVVTSPNSIPNLSFPGPTASFSHSSSWLARTPGLGSWSLSPEQPSQGPLRS